MYYCGCISILAAQVLCSILVLNIFHRNKYGARASPATVMAAFAMAKLTFTTLRDPSGHFKDTKEEFLDKTKTFFKCCWVRVHSESNPPR
jgi:hypothetical protein